MIKKICVLFFVLISAGIVFSCSQLFAEGQADQSSNLPTIVYIEGDVSVVSSPEANAVAAVKGMLLAENASVKTSRESYCDIALDQEHKNIISIGPDSDVKIGKDFKQINISKGRVFSQLNALAAGSQFEVATPQAIAGVRGTAWESIVGENSKFNVKTHTVYVKGIGKTGAETGENDVAEGFSVVVDPSGWLGELTKLTQEDMDRMESWSSRIERSLGSASSKNNCKGLIDGFDGGSANLFKQVIDCETAGGGSFAGAGGEGPLLAGGDSQQGITGGDITTTSFIKSPVVETQGGSTPPVNPPDDKPCSAGKRCN